MLNWKWLWSGLAVTLLAGCGGTEPQESLVQTRFTVDVSRYSAPNVPASLFLPNESLALPLEAKDLTLSETEPGSLQSVYTRSFCEVGQSPTELAGWATAELLEVPPVRLQAVSVTVAFNGNDLLRKPNFAIKDSAGSWSSCAAPTAVAHNATTLTATLALEHPDATAVGIFPDAYAFVHTLRYTLGDSTPEK